MDLDLNYKPSISIDTTNNSNSVNVNQTTYDLANNQVDNSVVDVTNIMSTNDKSKPNIEYRPVVGYDNNYSSNATIASNTTSNVNSDQGTQNTVKDKLDSLTNDLDNIFTIAQGLPDDIYNLVTNTASGVSYISGLFNPDYVVDPTLPSIEYTINSNLNSSSLVDTNNADLEVPENIFPDIEDTTITINDGDPVAIKLEKEFIQDMLNIFNDYTDKLNTSLNKYYIRFLKAVSDSNLQNNYKALLNKLDTSNINISDSSQFLVDGIIKNEIIKDQKVRLQAKLYNIDYFITNARQCTLANKLRQRYYSKDYDEESSYLKLNKNTILSDLRREYDVKYVDSLYNLYKYLNSSVILLNEALTLQATMCESKAVLSQEEGVTFK